MSLTMRVGLGQFKQLTDEKLAFIKQMGADDFLMNTPELPGDRQWEYEDLVALRERADAAELRLMALENVPISFYDKVMLGLPGRDEQIEHMRTTIRNMMTGPAFHDFLIRGANDRLLTNRMGTIIDPNAGRFIDFVNENYRSRKLAVESDDWASHWNWWCRERWASQESRNDRGSRGGARGSRQQECD